MDQQILSSLQQLQKSIAKIESAMVTKEDARSFANKDDLKNFATKDDLKSSATKDDLKNFATKDDLKSLATKDDLKIMQKEITEDLSSVIQDFANELDEKKADKTQFHLLHDRLTIVEQEVLQLHNKS